MSDITEYERRISAALARIGFGIEQIQAIPVVSPEVTAVAAPEAAPEAEPEVAATPEALFAETLSRAEPDAPAEVPVPVAEPMPDPAATRENAAEVVALREALEAERQANAQLSDRVRAIRDKQETMVTMLERRLNTTQRDADRWAREVARLKRANFDLTEANRGLTAALAQREEQGPGADVDDGVAAHLINRAMLAELEALRAQRAVERAELEEILAGLEPLIVVPTAGDTPAELAQEGTHA
jgi:hypothetical protein